MNSSRLVSYNNNPIQYDTIHPFLMKTYNEYEYSYQGKRLVSVSKDDKRINYTYDLEGLIIQKRVTIVEGDLPVSTTITKYYYDNRKLVKEVCGNTTISYFYDSNNQLYGYKKNSIVYFYIRDVLGNIIGILNNSGVIVSKFDYDAFGNIINQTGSVISNFRYKGYYYDTDIELYYLKTRFYNPVLLRFITPDSIEYLDSSSIIGLNLYAYCGNDPVNMVDENGNFGFLAFIAIAVVVCVSLLLCGDYKEPQTIDSSDVSINGKNKEGSIIVTINANTIHIVDSYRFGDNEKSQILDIIMADDTYIEFGYYRTKESYMKEWRAHNFMHALIPFGSFGEKTASVDLNYNEEDDEFSWAYDFFG